MMSGFRSRRWVAPAMLLSFLALMLATISVLAGDRDQSEPGAPAAAAPSHGQHVHMGRPTHIYAGGCDDRGEVVFALNPVGSGVMNGPAMSDPAMPMGERVGAETALPVEIGQITLDVPLAEIVQGRHALKVQESEMHLGPYVACGEVGGVIADDRLVFEVRSRNASGFGGMAVLDGKGDETVVTVYLAKGLGAT